MTEPGERYPTPSPEQAIRSFREDRLAGTGYEDLIDSDSATIHCVRYCEDDYADITVNSGNIVTLKTEKDAGAVIFWASKDLLLATDETYLPVVVCPPEGVANFLEILTKRSPESEVVTLEVDITPEKPTVMQEWAERWAKEERPPVEETRTLGLLTEEHYPDYLRSLGDAALIEYMAVPELLFPGARERRRTTMQEWDAGWGRMSERLGQAVSRWRAAQETVGSAAEQYRKTDLRVLSGLEPNPLNT
jgi:hypothetical protein